GVDGKDGGDDRADVRRLPRRGAAAGERLAGAGDEGAGAAAAVGDAAVAGLQGVRGNALGPAHEDESRGDSGDGADAALADEVRGQRDRGEAHGGDDEAEAVDEPVGFDPALVYDEGVDEIAD